MESKNKEIIDALMWRYAAKVFDATKKVSDADFDTIIESARLSPSVFGIEAWKFIVVKNPEVRAKLRAAGYDQSKITDASHLVVITRRTDSAVIADELVARTAKNQRKTIEDLAGLKASVAGGINSKSEADVAAWFAGQTYIPLGMMLETAALLGIDAGPMQGFDPKQVDEILGLAEKNLASVSMVTFGYRGNDPYALLPKTRRTKDEVIEVVE